MNAIKPQITWNAQLSASIVNEVIRRLIAGKFDVLEPLPRGLMLQTLWKNGTMNGYGIYTYKDGS